MFYDNGLGSSWTPYGDGDAGWIDEGIAIFEQTGRQQKDSPPLIEDDLPRRVCLFDRSPYYRTTNSLAEVKAPDSIGYVHFLLQDTGGVVPLLKKHFQSFRGKVVSTQKFKAFVDAETAGKVPPQAWNNLSAAGRTS